MSTLPPLFHELIDDAALFPPGNAPMADAVPAHHRYHNAWYSSLVGPFLCPASRLAELSQAADAPMDVAVVIDTGTGGIERAVADVLADSRLAFRGLEVPLRGEPPAETARRTTISVDVALAALDDPDEVAVSVEIPRGPGWREALEVVAESGHRAKLRTGGVTPDAFPPEDDVASFVLACLDLDVTFKLTAGLHRAIRHTTPDGLEQHGFLNVLLAVADALDGADHATVSGTLADRDATAVADRLRALPLDRVTSVRSWFGSYGSCSVLEPLDDLIDLGFIDKE